ncbi:RIP metalloprotease RseP [Actinopolymorpha cephalotaxi]|uniref:Membrane-associated protease RseP (Regulator of RpoE activity) n=1 Tax=Actinopolymorpha cephalotaxi TaxID=504797 RepID=A0A1I2RBB3_9ACTN|nr:site-2 protease family protein [Actinopolymorpha cephalotaxi]NYH82288.1 membrane-associated protease RseP (regulator of RpoE activity) [Actinopolymorpha cephalotaxi]SFG37838.1 RIP metalloprotease RseP [Actinopolymorpha cephalotaxi]
MDLIAIIGAVVFFVGVLASVALHEIGHFVPAKLFDVRVTQYMVGFGRTVWSRPRGETEYGLKLIPFGGYVRMIGMFPPAPDGRMRKASTGPFQTLIEEARNSSAEETPPGEEHRLFYTKKWWQKLIIMSGGPLMNIILAVLLFGIVLMGFGTDVPKPTVSAVPDCVVPAADGARKCTAADPLSPAKKAGLRPGDQIVAFDGTPVGSWDQASGLIREAGAGPVTIGVERDGVRRTLHATLIAADRPDPNNPAQLERVGFLGVSPTVVRERQGPVAVVGEMGRLTAATAQAMLHIPERMVGVAKAAFGQKRAMDSPMSVIGASRVAGEIASASQVSVGDRIATFLQWLGALNLFVALFNLVPLLPMDGGHIAGALYEAVRRGVARLRRRPDPGYVDVARALPVAYAVASVLIVMGVLLLYADIVNPVRISN